MNECERIVDRALNHALDLMEAEWEVIVVRGDGGLSFTGAEKKAIRDRVKLAVLRGLVTEPP